MNVREACTSHTCEWKAVTCNFKVEPQHCEAIRIYSPEEDVRERCLPYPGAYSAGPKVDPNAFVKHLLDAMESCNSDWALYLTLRAKPGDISDFLSLFHVYLDTFQTYVHRLRLTEDVARNVEPSTHGQGIHPNWKEARWHIIKA